MPGPQNDRRKQVHEFRPKPAPSAANALVLMVVGALAVFAAAAALTGTGYDDVTPHGQLLGDLHRVVEAQERHYRETGAFAEWVQTLDFTPREGVRVTIINGDASKWEAVADHQAGLTCIQGGSARGGTIRVEQPTCYAPGE
ncbi:MAG TPA: hypothetical protein VK966_11525 [Longimicrobiales bacterium]|nr:hypothetical protein [Longimicrobiales bacterium]